MGSGRRYGRGPQGYKSERCERVGSGLTLAGISSGSVVTSVFVVSTTNSDEDDDDNSYSQERRRIRSVHEEFCREALILPLNSKDAALVQLWRDMDLCSMFEGAFTQEVHPRHLSAAERQRLLVRLGGRYRIPPLRPEYRVCYFLIEDGKPVGTLALDTMLLGPDLLRVSALYLCPENRKKGLVERVLRSLQAALERKKMGGIRLDTYWVWQRTVRYYLRRGFWVFHWKHDLSLMWHRALPSYRIEMDADQARFLIEEDGDWHWLYSAERKGEFIKMQVAERAEHERNMYFLSIHAQATFSLALALSGWPLLRSHADLEENRYCDTGPPEALAYRLEWWEAKAAHEGWTLETPRIPCVSYRSYRELLAENEADIAEVASEAPTTT